MSSRALSLAAVLLLIGSFAPKPALAQENLDAGKTPSQLFAGTCNACHKSPRGLLKTVPASSLPSFLRQHYTTSPNMAGALASYLVSNGATDTRIGGDGPRGAKGAKEGTKEGARQQETRQEARQESRQGGQSEQLDRWGRRLHPQEANAPAAEPRSEPRSEQRPEGAESAVTDRGPDARKNAKQKLTKRGRPGEALPKEEPAAAVEPPKPESRPDKPDETAGREETRPDAAKPAEDDRSQSARVERPAETRVLRPDPVPPVTPAPSTTPAAPSEEPSVAPAAPSSAPAPAPMQAAASAPVTEMAVPLPASPTPPVPPPPVAAFAPPQPPLPPAGPPAPPISQ
jgi:hypothetical protein